MARLPLASLTVSVDGGTPETFAQTRRGSQLQPVFAQMVRLRAWKESLGSSLPDIDSFL
jgi:hypothetical protein